jgi:hypothetical protein
MCTPSGWAATLGVNTRVRELPLSVSVLWGGGEDAPCSALRHAIRAVEDAFVPSGAWKAVVSSRAVVSSGAVASGERVCSFLAASVCPCSFGASERVPAQPATRRRTAHPIRKVTTTAMRRLWRTTAHSPSLCMYPLLQHLVACHTTKPGASLRRLIHPSAWSSTLAIHAA